MTAGSRTAIVVAALVTVGAWWVVISTAPAMAMSMPMPGGWSMSMAWMAMGEQSPLERAAMFLVMWTVMMIAMMLPATMPAVMLHARLIQSRRDRGEPAGGSRLLLLSGYFIVWAAFGLVAYMLGIAVTGFAMRSERVSRLIPAATGVTLAVAGIYQLTGFKRACLDHCRSPFHFFSAHPLRGPRDSLAFGVHHGAYCAGCCWGLMAIQLVLGVMSLPLMAAVAGVIFIEKQWAHGQAFAAGVGIVSIAFGLFTIFHAVR